MTDNSSRSADAVFLGVCSLATQAVFIRFILSSQIGGELYAAIAIGCWIGWVGFGSLTGHRIPQHRRRLIWLFLSLVKMPLAFLIFLYPGFFTGVLDPVRFLPLAVFGMAPTGILYGFLFPLLIGPETRASHIYRNEAIGSLIGGLSASLWLLLGSGDFGFLLLLSMLEFSRFLTRKRALPILVTVGLILAFALNPYFDRVALNIRWPGFHTVDVAHGITGRWSLMARGDQLTVMHNGKQIGVIPDRASTEEALLWPFLFYPDADDILLVGFEGKQIAEYLPSGVRPLMLYSDRAYTRLNVPDLSQYEIGDPLSFTTERRFDIVSVLLHGAGNLNDYRMETDLFIKRCGDFLEDDGIFYVSTISDENYLAPALADYLSSLRNTLDAFYDSITVIPGARVGFVCFNDVGRWAKSDDISLDGDVPFSGFQQMTTDSPYFNLPLIVNRLAEYRISNFKNALDETAPTNDVLKPMTVLRYLSWQGSAFGKAGSVFDIYTRPYVLIAFVMLLIVPLVLSVLRRIRFSAILGVACLGFVGMSFEIGIIYLFQTLFGSLHLHIGMILAIFMAGLALGATYSRRLKPKIIMAPVLLAAIAVPLGYTIIELNFGLIFAYVLFYMASLAAGFSTGGGFAFFVDRSEESRKVGATLYGADLYGALLAAVFVPGILMSLGTIFLMIALAIVSLVILATLIIK
jgi:hypothetical protein